MKNFIKHNLFACNGILFNHESPRRGSEFVTQKIAEGVARIKLGKQESLQLGNLESRRDWGHAKDYVKAIWQMMQLNKPEDFVIATSYSHSIKEFCKIAFETVNLDWQNYVKVNPAFLRPNDVNYLRGDYTKARNTFGWQPTILFKDLVKEMVDTAMTRELRLT